MCCQQVQQGMVHSNHTTGASAWSVKSQLHVPFLHSNFLCLSASLHCSIVHGKLESPDAFA
jgi:hypothetical protein